MLGLDIAYMCTKFDHYQPFQRYGWCSPIFKWFTWPNHVPFRDDLSSAG